MRQATVILPQVGNGQSANVEASARAHSAFRAALIALFGGVTMTTGVGWWRDPAGGCVAETVNIYTVAAKPGHKLFSRWGEYVDDYGDARVTLLNQASAAACMLDQAAVYVQDFNGDVEIHDLAKRG